MKNCHQITRLLSDGQERPLAWKERMAIRLHISMCSGCRNFSAQMPRLRQIARAYAKSDTGDTEQADPKT